MITLMKQIILLCSILCICFSSLAQKHVKMIIDVSRSYSKSKMNESNEFYGGFGLGFEIDVKII